ncbi:hypothetical protein BYT27DRAFT_6559412 [Phlegmacium glaucopus]|nr:hypothetical protein BYT27DRAFT_6559412 [Phlegmacium glaucopus]
MTVSRPLVSSPLADSSFTNLPPAQRIIPKGNHPFPSSRALRPFPSISHAMKPTSTTKPPSIKLIQAPKNFKTSFVLNLTQAEFSRQE